jgi:choline dehydrogenase-like flavoprotein
VSGIGFWSSSQNPDPTHPDIQFHQVAAGISQNAARDFSSLLGIKEELLAEYFKNFIGKDAILVLANLALPRSRGSITLKSSDPFVHPKIVPNYFQDPNDKEALVDGEMDCQPSYNLFKGRMHCNLIRRSSYVLDRQILHYDGLEEV